MKGYKLIRINWFKLWVSVFVILLCNIFMSSCMYTEKDTKQYPFATVKEAAVYSAKQPAKMSTYIFRDISKINHLMPQYTTINIDKSAFCNVYNYENGKLYVFYDDNQEINFAVASEKKRNKDDFSNIIVDETTLDDIKNIDSAIKLNFINYPAFDEYYSIHLTNEGILFINYKKINNKLIVSSVNMKYSNYVSKLDKENLLT